MRRGNRLISIEIPKERTSIKASDRRSSWIPILPIYFILPVGDPGGRD